jgi:predicted dehydrogenase
MVQQPPRVAVVGCGRIATAEHLPSLVEASRRGLCSLVAVCDANPARAEAARQRFGVLAFATLEEMLDRARPNVITVATLPSSHRDLCLRALGAGCNVLCEKPIAMNLAEAREMVDAATQANRLLSICFEYRYWDEAAYVRQRIARGDLGHVHYIRTWGGGVNALVMDVARRHWSSAGGGVLTHWTIHNLDLALWLLGSPEVLTASAFGYQRVARLPEAAASRVAPAGLPDPDVEDFAFGFVRLANGSAISVEANFLQAPSSRSEGWEILADKATVSMSPIKVWLDRGDEWRDDTPPAGTLAPCDYRMNRLIEGFLERVRIGGSAPVTGLEILRVQGLMDALYESMRSGREVTLADPVAATSGPR